MPYFEVLQKQNGGYAILGLHDVPQGNTEYADVFLAELSPEGDQVWCNSYYSLGPEYTNCLLETESGGLVFGRGYLGSSVSGVWIQELITTDEVGNIQSVIEGPNGTPSAMHFTSNDELVVLSTVLLNGSNYYATLKTFDPLGNIMFQTRIFKQNHVFLPRDFVIHDDGSITIMMDLIQGAHRAVILVNLDAQHQLNWAKEYIIDDETVSYF